VRETAGAGASSNALTANGSAAAPEADFAPAMYPRLPIARADATPAATMAFMVQPPLLDVSLAIETPNAMPEEHGR
jgi:hypothetical protein